MTTRLYFDGRWQAGASVVENRNPSDLSDCIGQFAQADTAQLDAATVAEIQSALNEGGYSFDTKDDENAKNGLRQSLRKNPVFHRIPSGEWGLLEWYPNAKIEKEKDDDAIGAAANDKPVTPAAKSKKKDSATPESTPEKEVAASST